MPKRGWGVAKMEKHSQLTKWKKGQSGNPNGRPKGFDEMRKKAQAYSPEAIERLVEIMRNKKAGNQAIKACEILLDRAWGRVPFAVAGEGGEGPVKIAYEVSWKHSDDGGVTLDLTPNKEPLLLEADTDE
jgi:hypothetical protein